MPQIIEIKARCADPDRIRRILHERGADFRGTDHQVDTYFRVPEGRLKLRQGNIENTLIYYRRPNAATPKLSQVKLYPTAESDALHQVLSAALPTLVVVTKQREIYFIDHVKFHIDHIAGLGDFVEIEAIDASEVADEQSLHAACSYYMELFQIDRVDLLTHSYSDMILAQQ